MKIKYLQLFTFYFLIFTCSAQELTTRSKKAVKHYEKAISYYNNRQNAEAVPELKKAIKSDPVFIEAYMLLAGVYTDMRKDDLAVEQYKAAVKINPDFFPGNFYSIGLLQVNRGIYEDAKVHFEKFMGYPDKYSGKNDLNLKIRKKALRYIKVCEFANDAIKHPVPFEPVNLGENINSQYAEYLPTITADEQTLIITVREPADQYTIQPNDGTEENFYIGRKVDGKWSKAVNLGPPINTNGNEGAQCISVDGQILIFTACERSDGKGSCDLYFAKRIGDKWSNPMNMGPPINTRYWDSQPSLSSDGRTLYFVSNRPGGKGDKDIWQSTLTDDGVWGEPVNLGDNINTEESEQSPFIHPDNQTLYFASSGLIGMGGEDLFLVRKDKNGEWGVPVNLGCPLNTFADESSLIVNAGGEIAYFASDNLSGYGSFDLYSFELHPAARPVHTTYVRGKVYDSATGKSIRAKFELIDLATAKTVIESYSNSGNGEFLVCLPTGRNYALNVSKQGHLFYSEHFSLENTPPGPLFLEGESRQTTPFLMNVPLQPIETGGKVVLKNIFFETASYLLKDESRAELQKLGTFLLENPGVRIEISGHTDNVGDKKSNQALSENRAKAVYNELLNSQSLITKDRLTYKGYGDTKPLADNDTEDGRAMNRRTEVRVLGKQ